MKRREATWSVEAERDKRKLVASYAEAEVLPSGGGAIGGWRSDGGGRESSSCGSERDADEEGRGI